MRSRIPPRPSLRRRRPATRLLGPLLVLLLLAACARAERPWQLGATCYEVFVRSFADSDGDGIGDLRGLTARLDHLNDGDPAGGDDLGVRCVWLMPVAESPSYHGYDVSDHYAVERDYGTREDLQRFIAEAHRRGIRVLVDMVLNHVSSEHPAFQAALRDTAAPERALFRFQPTKGPLNEWGGDNWHRSPVRDEWYYGFFWQGMPDLDYTRPAALAEMQRVARFWLDSIGVDGFRLDAVKFLVEEPGRAQDTPGTHRVLREWAAFVRGVRPGVYTVGEVFDSTGALLAYYPDQLDGYFAFEVADSLVRGVRDGRGSGILAPALRLQREVPQAWRVSPFLRNHDQPRTRTELGGSREKAKQAAVLQLTLPGLPFVYYGEELGMEGTKPDERIRTPMAWALAGPHAGFTTGTPWQPLQPDSLESNVEAQRADPASSLALYRRLIRLRDSLPALAEGRLHPVAASDSAVVAYVRRAGNRAVLVVANLGESALADVLLSAPEGTLPEGRAHLQPLLPVFADVGAARELRAGPGGALRDLVAVPVMPPGYVQVFALEP